MNSFIKSILPFYKEYSEIKPWKSSLLKFEKRFKEYKKLKRLENKEKKGG